MKLCLQAVGIGKAGILKPQLRYLIIHHLNKALHASAAEMICQKLGRIAGAGKHHSIKKILAGKYLVGLDGDVCSALFYYLGIKTVVGRGNKSIPYIIAAFKHNKGSHYLGQRCRRPS